MRRLERIMVGGTVIEVVDLATKVYVNCADKPRGRKKADECAIYVERTPEAEKIEIGDAVWWQGGFAYWTPCSNRVSDSEAEKRGLKCGKDYDIKIPRRGYSGGRTLNRPPVLADLTDDNIERHMWRVVRNGRSPATANKDHGQTMRTTNRFSRWKICWTMRLAAYRSKRRWSEGFWTKMDQCQRM